MSFQQGSQGPVGSGREGGTGQAAAAPGRRTLTEGLASGSGASDVAVGERGLSGAASPYPFRQQIESSFGRSLTATAHTDGAAGDACATLGAQGYAYGNAVAFSSPSPSLHTAAHEAAHTLQQSQGVHLKSGAGGDGYEQHADAAADLVVSGRSAAHLFGGGAISAGVQKKRLQLQPAPAPAAGPAPAGPAAPAPAGAGPAPAAGATPGTLTPEQQAFFNKTVEANSTIGVVTGKFSAWLSSIAIAYSNAWSAHQTGLKAADQAAKDANALVIAVIMAGAGGAVGGAVGEAVKRLDGGAALVDGVKDLAKMGSRQVGTVGGQVTLSSPGGFQKMPANPLAWSQAINLRAETEVLTPARAAVLGWQHALNTDPSNFDTSFDPVAAINDKLTLAIVDKKPLNQLVPENQTALQKAFECGFLNDWIESQAFGVFLHLSQFSWGKAKDKIVQYGLSVGMSDVQQRVDRVVSRDTAAHNQRVIASGHGLI